jgi:hypothetical protein
MEPVSLEELIPEQPTFLLASTGKTYTLRKMNLADRSWMRQKFGDRVEEIFRETRVSELCQIVFRLLSDESKEDFQPKEVTIFDDDTGAKKKVQLGGWSLFEALVSTSEEFGAVLAALISTVRNSEPVIRRALEAQIADQKKSQVGHPTGPKSSTSSPASTDSASSSSVA